MVTLLIVFIHPPSDGCLKPLYLSIGKPPKGEPIFNFSALFQTIQCTLFTIRFSLFTSSF